MEAQSQPLTWEGEAELTLRPSIGEPISTDGDDNLVDDSDYEFSLRFWRPINRLNKMRVQLKLGLSGTPNYLDGDNPESAAYAEVQLGDTYVPFRNLLDGEFERAPEAANAIRPYARYRLVSVHDQFLRDWKRTDHKVTLGVRYRRVKYVMDDVQVPGLYFEGHAEVTRVGSSQGSEELWNPRLQFDVIGAPFWMGTRFVFKATGEGSLYTKAEAPDGDKRRDWRLRLTSGFDISKPLKELTGIKGLRAEVLGRFQRRWSNDSNREHKRIYFVPTVALAMPIK